MSALLAPQPMHIDQHAPVPVHRLCSPISLVQKSSSPPACTPSRRRHTGTPRRRRPHLVRAERVSHVFDQLPWITALEAAPEHTNPWDIADLSLLPDPLDAGPGPVRRRKTSLRSNPMGTSLDSASSSPECPPLLPCPPPFLQATPLSHFSPSRILFRNLMPVSHCDDASPHHCTNIRPLDF